jgi:ribosomal protein L16 Arg81 hydroxylase
VAEIRRLFASGSQINLYLTPPHKPGFAPHFDITDVFIVQCLGAKSGGSSMTTASRRSAADGHERILIGSPSSMPDPITLSAGDVLLPRGVMHEAFCTDRESMHLTISLMPLTVADLIAQGFSRSGRAAFGFVSA